jgi:hypothetical protein
MKQALVFSIRDSISTSSCKTETWMILFVLYQQTFSFSRILACEKTKLMNINHTFLAIFVVMASAILVKPPQQVS